MTWLKYLALPLCILGISSGQVLFKLCAARMKEAGLVGLLGFELFYATIALYGAVTFLWIWALQDIPLSRGYAFLAISFAVVPLFSRIFLGEVTPPLFWLGTALIVSGIFLVARV